MSAFLNTMTNHLQESNFAALFLDASLKSFVVLALAGALAFFWRRASAATRHLVWFLAVLSLPMLPLASALLPATPRPLWTVSTSLVSGNQVAVSFEFAPGRARAIEPPYSAARTPASKQSAANQSVSVTRQVSAHFAANWLVMALGGWFMVAAWLLISLAVGHVRAGRLARGASPMTDPGWLGLLAEACAAADVRRPVTLLQSAGEAMPVTWGRRRPIVLLPATAGDWPLDRRRVVLAHELAHIKRQDWLTQAMANFIRAIWWFNPLVWVATRRMCAERERACDDRLLTGGWKASQYAGELLDIARSFRRVPQTAAVAMARPSGLEQRVRAMLDSRRNHSRVAGITAAFLAVTVVGLGFGLGGCTKTGTGNNRLSESWSIERSGAGEDLKRFVAEKKAQASAASKAAGVELLPEYKAMFDAAERGDVPAINKIWSDLRERAPQYEGKGPKDERLFGTAWQTVLETWGAFGNIAVGEGNYTVALGRDAIASIPPGSIYFGGTDPGRCVITALCKSHVNADPFFTITQNALADKSYLQYVREMYGTKIYVATDADSESSFNEYVADVQQRSKDGKLKPGENFKDVGGKIQVSGQVAVMEINARIARLIFDKNPDREFYIEESFPLEWMYPHLSPNGPIMKISRQPLSELPDETIQKDRGYWSRALEPMIGKWLTPDTPLEKVAEYAAKNPPPPLQGDKRDNQADNAQKWATKLRSSIARVYAWRVAHPANAEDETRMTREADYAFRQAWAVCPYSPETVFRYVEFLTNQKRSADALLVAESAHKLVPQDGAFDSLAKQLASQSPAK